MTDPVSPAAVLAALARLEARIGALEDDAAPHDNSGDGDTAPAAPGAAASTAPACWWPDLDPAAATAAWGQLGAWVREGLLARHPPWRRSLRPCWRRHPNVVDELTALRLLWLDAHTNPQAAPTAAADYLNRLPVVLARVQAAFKDAGCNTEAGVQVHASHDDRFIPAQWDGDQVAAFITDDTGRRTP